LHLSIAAEIGNIMFYGKCLDAVIWAT